MSSRRSRALTIVDRDHWMDPVDSEEKPGPVFSHILLVVVALFLIGFLVWANFAVLDQVTRGEARVVPSSQIQVIQNLEGGIISEMLVEEGETVEKDQVLLRIDNTLAKSALADLQSHYFNGLATVARLEAEVAGKTADQIVYPDALLRNAPAIALAETALFRSLADQQQSQIDILRNQADQRQQEMAGALSKSHNLQASLSLIEQQIAITRPLVDSGVSSKTDMLQLERQANDLRGSITAANSEYTLAKGAYGEAISRIQEHLVSFRTEASQELDKERADLSSIVENMRANQDKVHRTDVRSPMRGIIKDIKVRTVGGVIQPGEDILEIVPIADTLLVEAQIRPADIAFIRPKQSAVVKITAFDYGKYGGLDAVVQDISADTIKNDRGEPFFRVRLRTAKNYLGNPSAKLEISPGMTATVDILTGKRTVLEYLLKPILRARDSAMRER
jgi:membrane fusion protein, adhesin transport system